MARVDMFITPSLDGQPGFHSFTNIRVMSRVPVVGEVVHLGRDSDGASADYEVVLMRHTPEGITDAQLYLRRVSWDVLLELALPGARQPQG
ncbi:MULTISPECIES: hypothetical protein [unclassified Corallococcus]|uniref:hypothetical protein n=1 Tax=unclassified Corallococcus TaxID=2685029 RepID=UPI001A8F95BA|nr:MULTISPECIES: hypothetical protein [unclassified Corallococcus]MBN9687107.1 hypothetical protein [Corallococcus sp. NCSPR001]WAS89065.1 hypothetical protein O0N60_19285 [Corallococcus sp. NCRR]